MSSKDLRPEQVKLLRSENFIVEEAKNVKAGRRVNRAALAGVVAALTATAAAAGEKLGSDIPNAFAERVSEVAATTGGDAALLQALAKVISEGHSVIESLGTEAGFRLMQANGGLPKDQLAETIKLVLGNG